MALRRLSQRRLLKDVTNTKIDELFSASSKTWSVYFGIDPTSDALHVGHLLGVLALRQFQKEGYQPVALVGGATGMIGDPTDRATERPLLSVETVEKNVRGIRAELSGLLDFDNGPTSAKLVNNLDWFGEMKAIDFVRDIGRYFRVGPMIQRDSMKNRLNSSTGLSYTEFSYSLFQGYDFLHLHREHGCMVQVGGSDQWGNIVSGVDIVRKAEGSEVFGVTTPLLTNGGRKFGKSDGNAIWLNPSLTPDFEFFQYFVQIQDAQVEDFLFMLTDLEEADILETMAKHNAEPHKRIAQNKLAAEILQLIRGPEAVRRAKMITDMMFGNLDIASLKASDVHDMVASKQLPSVQLPKKDSETRTVADFAVACGSVKSKGECRRLAKNGGLYLNDTRVGVDQLADTVDMRDKQHLFFRTGKKKYFVVQFHD